MEIAGQKKKSFRATDKVKVASKKNVYKFVKKKIISTKSLQSLFMAMKEEYDVKYILTHRLHQDYLEIFFCRQVSYTKYMLLN